MNKPVTKRDFKMGGSRKRKGEKIPKPKPGDEVVDQYGECHTIARVELGRVLFLDGTQVAAVSWGDGYFKAIVKENRR